MGNSTQTATTNDNCNADLNHPCDAGNNGEPCHECAADRAEWMEWGRMQQFHRYTEDEIRDCYSDPTETHKRNALIGAR